MAVTALVVVPAASIAAPNGPTAGQRVDLRVLLVAPSATDGVALAWRDTLTRFGVPFDMYVAGQSAALGDAGLADYPAQRARYESVILASSAVPLSAAERAALDKLETTFGVREISDNTTPDLAHGATPVRRCRDDRDAHRGRHPDRGRPGGVPVPQGQRAARRPVLRRLGHAGRELHLARQRRRRQLLHGRLHPPERHRAARRRHPRQRPAGALPAPARRDAELGHARGLPRLLAQLLRAAGRRPLPQRRRLEPGTARERLQPRRREPHDAVRPRQGALVVAGQQLPLDFAFNAGGHDQFVAGGATDALWNAFAGAAGAPYRTGFGFINHTYDHPSWAARARTTSPGRSRRTSRAVRPSAFRSTLPSSSPASTRARQHAARQPGRARSARLRLARRRRQDRRDAARAEPTTTPSPSATRRARRRARHPWRYPSPPARTPSPRPCRWSARAPRTRSTAERPRPAPWTLAAQSIQTGTRRPTTAQPSTRSRARSRSSTPARPSRARRRTPQPRRRPSTRRSWIRTG